MEKRCLLAQLVAVADGAAHDASLHVAAAFVARYHAVAHQEGGGANVVCNHPQALVGKIGTTGFAGCGFDQRIEQVNLVVAVHMLQDGGQAFQAHAGVHTRCRQWRDGTGLVHVELHEHVVPDLDETVAVFLGAARRPAGDMVAVVVKDLAAGAARACIGHHPEVVALVAATLVVANADDAPLLLHALGRPARLDKNTFPDGMGLVVFLVDGGVQLVGWQFVDLGQQFPGPIQRFALEVVAKTPVAHHLEEGVVARGVAHVFQVVVFATGAQAGLYRCGPHIRALVRAQKHVLELHHAGVGEHQRRVVAGHQWAAGHHGVAFGGKKVEESLANVGDIHGGLGHDGSYC